MWLQMKSCFKHTSNKLQFIYALERHNVCLYIIIIIILGISFMQGIYTYIPETNHFPREHFVITILM
jgi:phosphoribosyl 1,2-cyclic phosphodiesterase